MMYVFIHLFVGNLIHLAAQYTISAALSSDVPQKSPRVPPMLEIMSMTVTVAVSTILSVDFFSTYTRTRPTLSRKASGLE